MGWFDDVKDVVGVVGDAVGIGGDLMGAFGGDSGRRDLSAQNIALQREFAQNGIRWKVEDAARAGIHPSLALGAKTAEYSPVSVGGEDSTAEWLSKAGHDISRAVDKTRTHTERVDARMQALQLERGELENELLRSRIRQLNGNGPAFPEPQGGGPGAGTIIEKPLERVGSEAGMPWAEPGAITDHGWIAMPGGRLQPVPSKDQKERTEDNFILETMWALRNLFMPGQVRKPPVTKEFGKPSWLPEGFNDWEWNQWRMMWEPVRRREVYRAPLPAIEGR